ncbi:restriction endonuclease subunit S [Vibrio splendidus]|uniref:Restriction endonuclease subunit S n=1 Tax=Vibrio splendidus TaxID=29497 RepID=A0AA43FZF4_VIBSP|nr:restriction endonuclease subunit S [Vibrio splendidus]MDH5922804.1 restriction endonuclease subunit S [Vibrio splendidus]
MSGGESPVLRFKAFSEPWGKADFKEIAKDFNYGMNASAVTFNGKDKYIRITDIDDSLNTFSPSPLTSPEGGGSKKFKLHTGDIVFARTGASTGKPYLFSKGDGDLFFAGFLIKATITKGNPSFIYQFCKTSTYKKWVSVMSMRSGQPGINAEEYKGLCIPFPDEQEQQKIADFLTSVDTKIIQLTEKHYLLKKYKKGVMQQIFSQKVRFKDEGGNAFPKWKEYALKEILLLQSDSLKMGDEETYELITVKRGFGGVKSRGHFKGKDVLVKNQFNIHENEFVISKRQIVHGACGLVPSELDGAIVSNEYNVFRPVEVLLDIDYFNRFTTTPFMRRAFFINSDGVHIEKLLFKTQGWLKTKVHLPCLEEQQKIAQFLQSIDTKIEGVGKQIEQTKQFKKGLLQQMFV